MRQLGVLSPAKAKGRGRRDHISAFYYSFGEDPGQILGCVQ